MSDASVAATPETASLKTRLLHSENFMTNMIMLVVVLLLLSIGVMIVKAISHLPNAPIHIEQTGLNQAQYHDLKRQLGTHALGNFLQADLNTYVDRLEAISWVDQVDIRRDWQKGLLVKVAPRQAVAKFGSERLVDANGVVYKPADANELDAHYWIQLQGENQNAVVMMQQVKQISDWFLPLGLKINEVIVTPRMTWLFRFDNGLRVLVDNENTSEKLYQLSVMLQNQLHSQLPKIQTIDLRYKNGMAITWRTALASRQGTGQQGTVQQDSAAKSDNKQTTASTADKKTANKTAVLAKPDPTQHSNTNNGDGTPSRITNPRTTQSAHLQ